MGNYPETAGGLGGGRWPEGPEGGLPVSLLVEPVYGAMGN
jgi:hypothetical protein